jgi:hypothetical protein
MEIHGIPWNKTDELCEAGREAGLATSDPNCKYRREVKHFMVLEISAKWLCNVYLSSHNKGNLCGGR